MSEAQFYCDESPTSLDRIPAHAPQPVPVMNSESFSWMTAFTDLMSTLCHSSSSNRRFSPLQHIFTTDLASRIPLQQYCELACQVSGHAPTCRGLMLPWNGPEMADIVTAMCLTLKLHALQPDMFHPSTAHRILGVMIVLAVKFNQDDVLHNAELSSLVQIGESSLAMLEGQILQVMDFRLLVCSDMFDRVLTGLANPARLARYYGAPCQKVVLTRKRARERDWMLYSAY